MDIPDVKVYPYRNVFSGGEGTKASVCFPWDDEVASFGWGVESGPPEIKGRGKTADEAKTDLCARLLVFADQLEALAAQSRAASEKIKSSIEKNIP